VPDKSDRPLGLTVRDVARALGVSKQTVRRWSDSGILKGYMTPGGQRRFSQQDVKDLLEKLKRGQ
jgi:excisionase family DNA binding protein